MNALVTGGTGFLGGALARRLHALSFDVVAMGRDAARGQRLEDDGIRFFQADLADAGPVEEACRGRDVVFHCGALSSPWGRYQAFYQANVVGTQHVVEGCRRQGVQRLVHVSTPGVYFAHDSRLAVKETDALPARPANAYAATKRLAEAVVDEAHRAGLPVVTLRPRALFGPGDTVLLPRLLRALARGRLRVIGDGKNLADLTYIDNVVDALVLCVDAPDAVLGNKYNITNGEPVVLWDVIRRVGEELGYSLPAGRIPFPVAYGLAGVAEFVHRTVLREREPILTRYGVGVLARSQTLDIDAARRDLGYQPRVGLDEGLRRFLAWWKEQRV